MEQARLAWVNVDAADNDPVRFWSHVSAALESDADRLSDLLDLLEPEHVQRRCS